MFTLPPVTVILMDVWLQHHRIVGRGVSESVINGLSRQRRCEERSLGQKKGNGQFSLAVVAQWRWQSGAGQQIREFCSREIELRNLVEIREFCGIGRNSNSSGFTEKGAKFEIRVKIRRNARHSKFVWSPLELRGNLGARECGFWGDAWGASLGEGLGGRGPAERPIPRRLDPGPP